MHIQTTVIFINEEGYLYSCEHYLSNQQQKHSLQINTYTVTMNKVLLCHLVSVIDIHMIDVKWTYNSSKSLRISHNLRRKANITQTIIYKCYNQIVVNGKRFNTNVIYML